jgi:hypothetical protein
MFKELYYDEVSSGDGHWFSGGGIFIGSLRVDGLIE